MSKKKFERDMIKMILDQTRPIIIDGRLFSYTIDNTGKIIPGRKNIIPVEKILDGKTNRVIVNLEDPIEGTFTIDLANLVASYFVPNPHGYENVILKDPTNPSNCHYSNLEWVASDKHSTVPVDKGAKEASKNMEDKDLAMCIWYYKTKYPRNGAANKFGINQTRADALLEKYREDFDKLWHSTKVPDPDQRRRKQAKVIRPYLMWIMNNVTRDPKKVLSMVRIDNCDHHQMRCILRTVEAHIKSK